MDHGWAVLQAVLRQGGDREVSNVGVGGPDSAGGLLFGCDGGVGGRLAGKDAWAFAADGGAMVDDGGSVMAIGVNGSAIGGLEGGGGDEWRLGRGRRGSNRIYEVVWWWRRDGQESTTRSGEVRLRREEDGRVGSGRRGKG